MMGLTDSPNKGKRGKWNPGKAWVYCVAPSKGLKMGPLSTVSFICEPRDEVNSSAICSSIHNWLIWLFWHFLAVY